jgi:hypothetical protein
MYAKIMVILMMSTFAAGCGGEAAWTERDLETRTVGAAGVQMRVQVPGGLTETRIGDSMVKLAAPAGSGDVRPEILIGVDSPPHLPAEAEAIASTPGATRFRPLGAGVVIDQDGALNLGVRAWLPLDTMRSVRCELTLYGGKSDTTQSADQRRAWMERICSSIQPGS